VCASREVGKSGPRRRTCCADDYNNIETRRKQSHLWERKAYECVILPSSDTNDIVIILVDVCLLIAYFHHNAAGICCYTWCELRTHSFLLICEFRLPAGNEHLRTFAPEDVFVCVFISVHRENNFTCTQLLQPGCAHGAFVKLQSTSSITGLINSPQKYKEQLWA